MVAYYKNKVINFNCSLRDSKCINKVDNRRYYELIVKLEMENKEDVKMCYLSIGERQRAELIITLSSISSIYLIDEPCSSLNSKYRKVIYDYIERLGKKYCVIVVSHSDIEPTLRIENKKMVGDGSDIKGDYVSVDKPSFSILLLYKLWFSKIKTFINLICLSMSILMFYITFNIDRYLLRNDSYGIGKNILIKIEPILYDIKLLGVIILLSTLLVYVMFSIFDMYIHKQELKVYISKNHNVIFYLILKFIVELIIVFIIGGILLLIVELKWMK
jgi:hypothetical protein